MPLLRVHRGRDSGILQPCANVCVERPSSVHVVHADTRASGFFNKKLFFLFFPRKVGRLYYARDGSSR